MSHYAHDVYIPVSHDQHKKIDTVFASYDDPEEMRRSLINHDGYDANIVVICNQKRAPQK